MKQTLHILAMLTICILPSLSFAGTYILPPEGIDVFGETFTIKAKEEDTLLDIGRRYGVGFNEMKSANPNVDMWVPGKGTAVTIPTQFILPPGPRDGVVVNVAEMRIYFYPKPKDDEKPIVTTFPISVGRMDWNTPLGETKITAKVKDPAWYPPKSIRDEHEADGDPLPLRVPPGPDNPLGNYAMRLGIPGYLIHGTNKPQGLGMRVTHGCIRMYPEDIEYFFNIVPKGTKVRIINAPYKAGWLMDQLYLEAHELLEEDEVEHKAFDNYEPLVDAVARATELRLEKIDRFAIKRISNEKTGVPQLISRTEATIR
ncbi:MAG: hypothetical protein D6B28_11890 [Gammaproteobacteria bacterium]|nr:MAG: hypothetical protein D6B28_11890 [Gammaproteobacteria bacterium]